MALDAVREILSTPSALALAARPGPDVAALTARREQIHAELEEWAAMHLTPREHKIATAPLRDELDRVERQLADAYRGTVLEDIARAPDPAAKFDALPTIAQKREVLRKLIKVTLLPVKGSPGAMKGTGEDWKVGERWFNRESVQIEFLGALREQPR
jgi:hypothetical protein